MNNGGMNSYGMMNHQMAGAQPSLLPPPLPKVAAPVYQHGMMYYQPPPPPPPPQ